MCIRDSFYGFLRVYVASYSYKAIEVWDMKRVFEGYVMKLPRESLQADPKELLEKVDWNKWLFNSGMPDKEHTIYNNDAIKEAIELADYYLNHDDSPTDNNYKKFTLDLRIIFMRRLVNGLDKLSHDKIKRIDNDNGVTEKESNPEVNSLWFRIAILKKYEEVDKKVKNFLRSIGRQKYILPQYSAYIKVKKKYAEQLYKEMKPLYHPIAQRAIDQMFGK
eukprot:TRINITY_DN3109_c0_g1_i10.p1 TRINITY_DN3109_c0_g1~~TRINITY_DN3109_c0_g1_i10.p1  ORF type:complete len:220 (+),score=70.83 TRINITY_DN3109_c0_g1_i10:75-734(+)